MIALVDYENVGSLECVPLARYKKVVLFTGPKQEFIRFPATTLTGDISVQVVQVPTVSKNNVDFHLVFELGRLSILEKPDVVLHVISDDKGYDGVISRLCESGRQCARVATKPILPAAATPRNRKPHEASMAEVARIADRIVSQMNRTPKAMPGTQKSLDNFLRAQSGQGRNEAAVMQLKEELTRRGVVSVYEKTVTWLRSSKQNNRTKN
ncbi:PIN domain-containing protein [Klebsiella sp. PL-2018]|uniref:PIN domain-containing protein n=1 Tax=Klebsiella sp. PL-2018 TaxID=2851540 RepID=UPI001C23EF52|nr:PIN domain-containing protein [Klebsiella sp. PL-2018]QXD01241.1 unknown [Klebsiella sp. PL-2018]